MSTLSYSENVELLRELNRSLACLPAHHFRCQVSRNSWLQSLRFQTSLQYYFAWFILQANAAADESDHRDREEIIDSTLSQFFNLILIPRPVTDLQFFDGPITNILDISSVGLSHSHAEERLSAFSSSYTAHLFFQAFLSPSGEIGCTPLAGALCRVVCTRDRENFCQDDIKDLFLAGLFTPKREFPQRTPSFVPFLFVQEVDG